MDSSPFLDVLGTGYVPNIEQKSQLRYLVKGYSDKIESIDDQIRQLVAQRTELHILRDQHDALLSNESRPYESLPPEVLAQIFLHCLPTNSYPACDVKECPLLLTTVCRSWREVASSTPRLWSSIKITIPALPTTRLFEAVKRSYMDLCLKKIAGINAWLHRSGCLPISFSVHLPRRHPFSSPHHYEGKVLAVFVGNLFRHSSRWERAVMDISTWGSLNHTGIDFIDGSSPIPDFPLLKALQINSLYWIAPSGGPLHEWQRTLIQVPSLRELVVQFFDRPLDLPVRWENIVRLDLLNSIDDCHSLGNHASIPIDDALDVLKHCSSIQSFGVIIIDELPPRTVKPRDPPIRLAHLDALNLEILCDEPDFGAPFLAGVFLDSLLTPSLLDLSVKMRGRPTADEWVDGRFITELVGRSDCHLLSLSLCLPILDRSVIEVLNATPGLISLHLEEVRGWTIDGDRTSTITDFLLESLSPDGGFTRVPLTSCPSNLEHITLTLCRWKSETRRSMASFARAWKTNLVAGETRVGKLKKITLGFADLQPVREGIENVLTDERLDRLEDWKPAWRYLEPHELYYRDD
ncbi:hypothetical protein V5O48_006586 [Marasmius crinis-equi]|uniref:F-box domain-containing protein n=1 Tax=Marasmius crinis-equi TaxID=585013 RepID=A0ABR3FJ37_9AGAR